MKSIVFVRCRAIDKDWVAEIKSSIRQAPGELVTKVPVMIPLNVVSKYTST